ncbi:uncharacterized protein LOC121386925 isoform X2 [Gigantopelta aegis]|uniref:uncharacterized protein LOC121386925 isoform X2 n=1 Tax=Gigantopelta aegis TaxID=1735272 RepID=UPI001B88DAD3|nr:uncharacterized protein LOC121386925 isoform X2 [Gigantopelta aegis]
MISNLKLLVVRYLVYSLLEGHITGYFHDENGDCDIFGRLYHMKDQKVSDDFDGQRAENSMPSPLTLLPSNIISDALGVWSTVDIPSRTLFGPMKGTIIKQNATHFYFGPYIWQLDDVSRAIDTSMESEANWMRYVITARHGGEANLKSMEHKGQIYFYSFKAISASTELVVWPGHSERASRSFKKPGWCWNPITNEACWPFFMKCKSRDCLSHTLQCERPNELPVHNCPKCESQFYNNLCPLVGRMNVIEDIPISANGYDPDRAKKTLPPGFVIKKSSIKGAGLGVFTTEAIPSRTLIGPYEGVVYRDVNNSVADNTYTWVYYYTTERISRGEELFVWYGERYDKYLNIERSLTTRNDRYDETKWPFFYTCPEGNCAPRICSLPPPCTEDDHTEQCFGGYHEVTVK